MFATLCSRRIRTRSIELAFGVGALVLLAMPTTTAAQSGRDGLLGKDGLIIGFGLGGGYVTATTKTTQFGQVTEATVDHASFAGDFKLGGGLGEKVLLYWFGKSAVFHGDDSFGIATQTSTITALSGVGASYYLKPRISVSAGAGATSLTTSRQTAWGVGFAVGAEYEFARHWLIDLDFVFGKPKPDEPPGIERETTTFFVKATLNWLYY